MKLLKILWEGWKKFALIFGEFMSGVILTVFYFVFVTPHAVIMNWFSDPLDMKGKPGSATSWQAKKSSMRDMKDAHRQF